MDDLAGAVANQAIEEASGDTSDAEDALAEGDALRAPPAPCYKDALSKVS